MRHLDAFADVSENSLQQRNTPEDELRQCKSYNRCSHCEHRGLHQRRRGHAMQRQSEHNENRRMEEIDRKNIVGEKLRQVILTMEPAAIEDNERECHADTDQLFPKALEKAYRIVA